jgi:hypothetical protein
MLARILAYRRNDYLPSLWAAYGRLFLAGAMIYGAGGPPKTNQNVLPRVQ